MKKPKPKAKKPKPKETTENVLYFIASRENYKDGKINLLTSQSGVLKSREHIKRIMELRSSEQTFRTKISKTVNRLKLDVKRYTESLPKTNENVVHKPIQKRTETLPILNEAPVHRSEISRELSSINQKLAELGGANR